jgi:predicted 3-demethylubiquinone-9 3-methyltransferase (glyoxalase superfamily)
MILYKEIQEEPIMINLNPDTIQWNHIPSSVGFWQNTPEFDNLYSEAEDGYILEAGNEVIWIKSKLGYGYQLTKNSEQVNTNIGLLKFNIKSHAIDSF